MAPVYGWLLALAVVLQVLVGFKEVSAQNTTECYLLATNILCTNEHALPPNCKDKDKSPIYLCAQEKDTKALNNCHRLSKMTEAYVKSTYDTVDVACSDQEISSAFQKNPECWRFAAECSIKLNAIPEGMKIECGKSFNDTLVACLNMAPEGCANLHTAFLKKRLANHICHISESAFPVSSAHFPAVLASLSLFALLILRLLI